MWSIIDKKSSEEAKSYLRTLGEVIEFTTDDIVYNAISGHPDIFICQVTPQQVIVAPNIPQEYLNIFIANNIEVINGEFPLSNKYPHTSLYNAVFTPNYLICNSKYIDSTILNHIGNRKLLHVNQGYVRCNTLYVSAKNVFITSDMSIYNVLMNENEIVTYINPAEVSISDFKNGFIGGCMGLYNQQLFINGSLKYLSDGYQIIELCKAHDLDIVELADAPLYDGGGIMWFSIN